VNRDDLPVEKPCDADWQSMRPAPEAGASARFCEHCQKSVHDLSALTEQEAAEVLARPEAPCVRYTSRPDGTIVHARSRRRLSALAGLLATAPVLAGSYDVRGCSPEPEHSVEDCVVEVQLQPEQPEETAAERYERHYENGIRERERADVVFTGMLSRPMRPELNRFGNVEVEIRE